jgi:hypothetical protein
VFVGGNWTVNGPDVMGPEDTDPTGDENTVVGGVCTGTGTFIVRHDVRFRFFAAGRFVAERVGEAKGGCGWIGRSVVNEWSTSSPEPLRLILAHDAIASC